LVLSLFNSWQLKACLHLSSAVHDSAQCFALSLHTGSAFCSLYTCW
jgi:hypothetical protein